MTTTAAEAMAEGVGSRGRAGRPGLAARARGVLTSRWFLRDVLLPVVLTRLFLIAVGLAALARFPFANGAAVPRLTGVPFFDLWQRWDAGWYMSIAQDGYVYRPGAESNLAFYPAFPMLARLLALPFGGGGNAPAVFTAGLLVSALALPAAMALLHRLIREDFGPDVARRVVLYVLVFPTSLYLSSFYTESLFLLFTLGALYFGRARNWWAAGALGGLAVLTRPTGVLLLIPLAWAYFAALRSEGRSPLRPGSAVLALGLLPAVQACWAFFLYRLTGNPLMITRSSNGFSTSMGLRRFIDPFTMIRMYVERLRNERAELFLRHEWLIGFEPIHLLDLLTVFGFSGLLAAAWFVARRRGEVVFAALLWMIPCCNGALDSVMRYVLPAFPAFAVLALLGGRSRVFHWAWVALCLALGALLMARYSLAYWVA